MKPAPQPSPELTELNGKAASLLHQCLIMEALVLVAAMTMSGLLALGGTRAVLGIVLLAIGRDAASR